jgi:3-keto-5-aminohexanoate cleavage enzyme
VSALSTDVTGQLPNLMVAPNGARRTKADHPALPMTIEETVATAVECFDAGADGLHLHVRDEDGAHTLDIGLYREALQELAAAVPGMAVQITTEAVGRYQPAQQRTLVADLHPQAVSISIAEMTSDDDSATAIEFYQMCVTENISVQHILYSADDVSVWVDLMHRAKLDLAHQQSIFVLGRYTAGQISEPSMLQEFLQSMHSLGLDAAEIDWAICAFGQQETQCLVAAHQAGGKMRVGFENSLWNADGSVAASNAERVKEIVTQCALSSAGSNLSSFDGRHR